MKKILLSGAVAILLIGCGDSKLDKEDVVCEFDHPFKEQAFGITFEMLSKESVLSCTNKAGEKISGMVEVDSSEEEKVLKYIKRLYIQDGLIAKYEHDLENSGGVFKTEVFFKNGRFVKMVKKGKGKELELEFANEYTWGIAKGKHITWLIQGVTSRFSASKG